MSIYICTTQRFSVLDSRQSIHYPTSKVHNNNDNNNTNDSCNNIPSIINDQFNSIRTSNHNNFPIISLYDILEAHGSLHRRNKMNMDTDSYDATTSTNHHHNMKQNVQKLLYDSLVRYGYVLIHVPKGRASTTIRNMRSSLYTDMFPTTTTNNENNSNTGINNNMNNNNNLIHNNEYNKGNLVTSTTIYVSERGIPMYRLGYELCNDSIREVFRIAGGTPDTITWPNNKHISLLKQQELSFDSIDNNYSNISLSSTRSIWIRGLGLLRHITDAALDLLLMYYSTNIHKTDIDHQSSSNTNTNNNESSLTTRNRHKRPYSGTRTWWNDNLETTDQKERNGDYSVLYAMHYFNNGTCTDIPNVAVKEHVDPSLLVIEPFLCTSCTGLQIWDRMKSTMNEYRKGTNNINASNNNDDDKYWIDCDGPNSPFNPLIMNALHNNEEIMVLFAGKALTQTIPTIAPTLHRVITGTVPRRTIIYEQKYAEFYPTPDFD